MPIIHDIHIHSYIKQKRKTLCLSINPNGEISLKVPQDICENQVHDFVLRKKKWLQKKLAHFATLENKNQGPLASGQSIFYLGKPYTLIIRHDLKLKDVILNDDNIILHTTRPDDVRHNTRVLQRWLLGQAERVFHERLSLALKNFPHIPRPLLKIRKYKGRWGSYASNHVMSLNSLLIHTSMPIIDYIIIHELCHHEHKKHDANFYTLLSQKEPQWKSLKKSLDNDYIGLLL